MTVRNRHNRESEGFFGNVFRFILFIRSKKGSFGFTLIEFLVVVTIVGVLTAGTIYTFDPFSQLKRGKDAERRDDLAQIKNAVEAYYQDNNCYPTSIPFGSSWTSGSTVYMQKVPQDVTCASPSGYCYQYITDTGAPNNCPQWNVLFARLSEPTSQSNSICPLSSINSSCVPQDYDSNWACALSGAVNCQLLSVSGFVYNVGVGDPGTQAVPTITPTIPVATPTLPPGAVSYNLGGGFSQNPYMQIMTIYPLWADPEDPQTFILHTKDDNGDITDVKLYLFSDAQNPEILTLDLSSGTASNGTWSGLIDAGVYNTRFAMAIVASDSTNQVCTVLTPKGSGAQADAICDSINN